MAIDGCALPADLVGEEEFRRELLPALAASSFATLVVLRAPASGDDGTSNGNFLGWNGSSLDEAKVPLVVRSALNICAGYAINYTTGLQPPYAIAIGRKAVTAALKASGSPATTRKEDIATLLRPVAQQVSAVLFAGNVVNNVSPVGPMSCAFALDMAQAVQQSMPREFAGVSGAELFRGASAASTVLLPWHSLDAGRSGTGIPLLAQFVDAASALPF